MCGRFALVCPPENLKEHFGLSGHLTIKPRYNIAPQESIPVVHELLSKVTFMRWGLTPSWVKASDMKPPKHINARSESAFEKPSFKMALKKRRCLIPLSGYFEWKMIGQKKQPFFVHGANQPLIAMAGIWEKSQSESLEFEETVAILTREATPEVAGVHERQPVIIAKSDYSLWLDESTSKDKLAQMMDESKTKLSFYPVTPRVNRPQFDEPGCLEPLSE